MGIGGGSFTGEGTVGRGEADVIEPGYSDEGPGGGGVSGGAGREDGEHYGGDGEEEAVGEVAADHGPSTADFVDGGDADHLSDEGEDRGYALILEGVFFVDAHLVEDDGAVVLDCLCGNRVSGMS
jgi:hypothetical protein